MAIAGAAGHPPTHPPLLSGGGVLGSMVTHTHALAKRAGSVKDVGYVPEARDVVQLTCP